MLWYDVPGKKKHCNQAKQAFSLRSQILSGLILFCPAHQQFNMALQTLMIPHGS